MYIYYICIYAIYMQQWISGFSRNKIIHSVIKALILLIFDF